MRLRENSSKIWNQEQSPKKAAKSDKIISREIFNKFKKFLLKMHLCLLKIPTFLNFQRLISKVCLNSNIQKLRIIIKHNSGFFSYLEYYIKYQKKSIEISYLSVEYKSMSFFHQTFNHHSSLQSAFFANQLCVILTKDIFERGPRIDGNEKKSKCGIKRNLPRKRLKKEKILLVKFSNKL